jgi:hypothetical protein
MSMEQSKNECFQGTAIVVFMDILGISDAIMEEISPMTINEYLKEINLLYKSGSATEHSYRGYVTQLIKSQVPGVDVTNEPQRIACGAPDYIITRKGIPIGFIEAKV